MTVRRFFTGFLLYARGMAQRTEAPAADLSLCRDQSSRIWRHTGNPHPPRPAHRVSNSNSGRRGAPHRRTPSSGRAFFGRRRYADDRVGQRCGYQKHRNLRGQPGFSCATGARHMRKCWRSAITLKPENATPQGKLLIIGAVKDLSTPCRTQRKAIAVRRRAQTFWTGGRLKPLISITKTWLSSTSRHWWYAADWRSPRWLQSPMR